MRLSVCQALLALLGSQLQLTVGLPQETIRSAAEFFAQKGIKEIQKAAAEAGAEQMDQLEATLPIAHNDLQKTLDSSLWQAQQKRDVEKRSQAVVVADMVQAISEARSEALPAVAETAEAFAKRRALLDSAEAQKPFLQTTLKEEQSVENVRRDASATIKAALVTSMEMQELAREAHDVADRLHQAHAQGHAQAVEERNKLAEAQARQSLRIVRKAGQVMHQEVVLASSALNRAKAAEQQALEALQTARTNGKNLQLLKAEAEKAYERQLGLRLLQKKRVAPAA